MDCWVHTDVEPKHSKKNHSRNCPGRYWTSNRYWTWDETRGIGHGPLPELTGGAGRCLVVQGTSQHPGSTINACRLTIQWCHSRTHAIAGFTIYISRYVFDILFFEGIIILREYDSCEWVQASQDPIYCLASLTHSPTPPPAATLAGGDSLQGPLIFDPTEGGGGR